MGPALGTACLGLRYARFTTRVESDDASHLDWLREFLTPSFEAVETPRPARTVRLRVDPERYADAARRGPRSGDEAVPWFWLDTGVLRLPLWTAPWEGRVVFDRDRAAFFTLDPPTAVEILTSGDGLAVRDALMRVVRELAMSEAWRQGALVLHAAAAIVDDRVILIAGPKGAGKTTLLVHLLRGSRARFVSNDRVVIPADGPAPAVRGLPTIVKLLRESAQWFPDLYGRLLTSPFHHRLTLAEARHGQPHAATTPPRSHWTLTPAQLCSLVGATPVPGGRLEAIVFPRVTGDPGTVALRRLPLAEAAAAITATQLGALRAEPPEEGAPAWPWESGGPNAPVPVRARALAEARCRELATRVPAFECRLGPDAYGDASSAARLLAAVGA